MKSIITILILLASATYAQNEFRLRGNAQVNNFGNAVIEANNTKIVVEQNARLNNSGTISVKDRNDVSQQAVGVEFYGVVENENGLLDFNYYGTSVINQPYLNGRVAFTSSIGGNNGRQFIPLIEYDSVSFAGTRKSLQFDQDNSRSKLVARENFTSTNSLFEHDNNVEIESHKHTEHDSRFENSFDNIVFAQTTDSLDSRVNGNGRFKTLRIDNPNGVEITRGGFAVENRLELLQGELDNSDENLSMVNESAIYREANSSINSEPEFEGTVLVQYQGDSPMESGPEIPTASNVLTDLNIVNNGGVTFTKDVFVRDRIEMGANAFMDHDGNQNTLYYLSPDYSGLNFSDSTAEVHGNMARANQNLPTDSRLTFNNAFTYMQFNTDNNTIAPDLTSDGGNVDTVIVRVEPGVGYDDPTYGDGSELKVQRKIRLSAKDNEGNDIAFYNNASFGYGWRHDADDPKAEYHETRDDSPDVTLEELGLQRYDSENNTWIDEQSQVPPNYNEIYDWAFSQSRLAGPLGEFSIGINITKYLSFIANAILEGPYDLETNTMRTNLLDNDMFPKDQDGNYIFPREYPFTLVPDELRYTVDEIPENVVDWILIEFRNGQETSTESFYKACFLRNDGVLLDTAGNENIVVWEEESGGIDVSGSTPYYVAIHHRNHMAVVSQNLFAFSNDVENPSALNFSDLSEVYNGTMALKFIGLDDAGERIYSLFGGNASIEIDPENLDNSDQRQIVEQFDLNEINDWIKRENYLLYLRADTNLDGLVNAKDYNISWNNQKNRFVDSFVK